MAISGALWVAAGEHRFEELAGCVPSWPQITKLREELDRFKDFESSIKLYEKNQKQFGDLTTPTDKKDGKKLRL